MQSDLPAALEIGTSRLKLVGLLAGALLFVAVGIFFVYRHWIDGDFDIVAGVIGVGSIVFFGLVGVVAIRQMAWTGTVLSVDAEGIRDIRVAAERIPWSTVRNVRTWTHRKQKVMVVDVDPATEAGLTLTRTARWSRRPNRALRINGLCFAVVGLKCDYDTLFNTSLAFWNAGGSRPAST